MMRFAPLHGWLRHGPQKGELVGWRVWNVEAWVPKDGEATPVVLMTKEDYEDLTKRSRK